MPKIIFQPLMICNPPLKKARPLYRGFAIRSRRLFISPLSILA